MSTVPPLDIKVVYSASPLSRRRSGLRRAAQPTRRLPLVLLGILNLAAASGLYYAAWWRVDKFLYMTLMLRTPVLGVDSSSGVLLPVLTDYAKTPPPASETPPSEAFHFEAETAQVIMGVTAYSWLTLATIAFCALGLAGGAALGGAAGAATRRAALVVGSVGLVVLAYAAYYAWSEYGRQYPPNYLRAWMGGLVVVLALIGLALPRGVRGLTRLAAVTLVLSAIGSAAGLSLGALCEAIPPEQSSPLFVAIVFAIHSLWGWLLLPMASRVHYR